MCLFQTLKIDLNINDKVMATGGQIFANGVQVSVTADSGFANNSTSGERQYTLVANCHICDPFFYYSFIKIYKNKIFPSSTVQYSNIM